MNAPELYLPPAGKRAARPKINWTNEMIMILQEKYPFSFNKELAKELGVSWRSLVRKARDLGVDKEPAFLEKRREIITNMAVAKNHNCYTGIKGWAVPNSEGTRFKKGNISIMKIDPEVVEKVRLKRNQTIRRERIRISIGLPQKTKLRLVCF